MTIQTQNIKEWNKNALEFVFCSICIKHAQTRLRWNLNERCPCSSWMSIRPALFLCKQIQYGLAEAINLILDKVTLVWLAISANHTTISDYYLGQSVGLHISCLKLKYSCWRSLLANKKWGFGPCSIRKTQVLVAYAFVLQFELTAIGARTFEIQHLWIL